MNGTRSSRWFLGVAFAMLVVGVLLGASAGGITAFLVAREWAQPQAVAAQSGTLSEFVVPAAQVPTEAPTLVPTQEPTATPAPTLTPAPAVPLTDAEAEIVGAVQRVQPATVLIQTNAGSSGSGFVVTEDGYIVTNNHVVEGATQFAVTFDRGERVQATLVGATSTFDLAVLKVEVPVPAIASWGDSSAVPVGASVIAIGSALGEYQNTVTLGILSGVNRELGGIPGLLQTDAAINHGNSGGPLLNRAGEVIGINSMVVRGGSAEAEGLGFAIPSNLAKSIAQQLIETGQVQLPIMGVTSATLNPQIAQENNLAVSEGAYVTEVPEGLPSAAAGIQPGDVIVAVDGRAVNDREPLLIHILTHKVGDTISVTLLRGSETLDVQVTLALRPA